MMPSSSLQLAYSHQKGMPSLGRALVRDNRVSYQSSNAEVSRANRIEIALVHNHMLDEEPRLIFMHLWAYSDAVDLAKGLKAALGQLGA